VVFYGDPSVAHRLDSSSTGRLAELCPGLDGFVATITYLQCSNLRNSHFSSLILRGWFGSPVVFKIRRRVVRLLVPVFRSPFIFYFAIRMSIFHRFFDYLDLLDSFRYFFSDLNSHLVTIASLCKIKLSVNECGGRTFKVEGISRSSPRSCFFFTSFNSEWFSLSPEAWQFSTLILSNQLKKYSARQTVFSENGRRCWK